MTTTHRGFGPSLALVLALALPALPAAAQEDPPEGADGAPLVINLPDGFAIGLIDMQRILQESEAAGGVREEIEDREERYRGEIEEEEETLRETQEELAQQRGVLSPQEFAVKEAEFRVEVEALQKRINERNAELQEIMAASIRMIQEQVVRIVADIALERNYALVFDTTVVVIAAEQINISGDVIERLNDTLPEIDINAIETGAGDGEEE